MHDESNSYLPSFKTDLSDLVFRYLHWKMHVAVYIDKILCNLHAVVYHESEKKKNYVFYLPTGDEGCRNNRLTQQVTN